VISDRERAFTLAFLMLPLVPEYVAVRATHYSRREAYEARDALAFLVRL
jgi:hypothetical protein